MELELLPSEEQHSALGATLTVVNGLANTLLARFERRGTTVTTKELKAAAREEASGISPKLVNEAVRKAEDALGLAASKATRYRPRQQIRYPVGAVKWKAGKAALPTARGTRAIPIRQPAGGFGGLKPPLDDHEVELVERADRFFLVPDV